MIGNMCHRLLRTCAGLAPVAAMALCVSHAAGQPCEPVLTWPVAPLDNFVNAMVAFDDGSGWALYMAGSFRDWNSPVVNVGRWDGQSWSPVGSLSGAVFDLAVFDDGSGPVLYAGGRRSGPGGVRVGFLAYWNSQEWIDVSVNGPVSSLATFDDGTGEALYVGGGFTEISGMTANYVARWDGQQWSALGNGPPSGVTKMASFDLDPAGPALYVMWSTAGPGGELHARFSRWDGQSWSTLPSGTNGSIAVMTAYDDGTEHALYVTGRFTEPALWFARWNGTVWSPVGFAMNDSGSDMAVLDTGTHRHLYAVGWFTTVGPKAARWDGTQWSSFGDFSSFDSGRRIAVTNDGAPALYMAFHRSRQPKAFARFGCVVEPDPCYPDCNADGVLDVNDFLCFIDEFAAAQFLPPAQQVEHYANCDGSTTEPVLSVNDFLCFVDEFAQGCP